VGPSNVLGDHRRVAIHSYWLPHGYCKLMVVTFLKVYCILFLKNILCFEKNLLFVLKSLLTVESHIKIHLDIFFFSKKCFEKLFRTDLYL